MVLIAALVGCEEPDDAGAPLVFDVPIQSPEPTGPGEGFVEGQFCVVRGIFEVGCTTGCHSAVVAEAGLDLLTDPFNEIVYKPSSTRPDLQLVVPRYPEESFLYLKMQGILGPTDGAVMPPQGVLDPYFLDPVRDWILAGAPLDCEPGVVVEETFVGDEPYHPEGWEDSGQHGLAAKLQTDGDCRTCHGPTLEGGTSAVTCDDCHEPGWRTNCTFCHGGSLDQTGAPPSDIDGQTDPALISFQAHYAHLDGDDHATFGCTQCHYEPTDVLTPGHVFDDLTPGYGEINYTGGLSPIATYFQGTCSNAYCHGSGLTPGTATDGQGPIACYGCHPDQTSQPPELATMSGRHQQHVQEGVYCSDCHSQVVDAAQYVLGPQYHVDGYVQVLPIAVVWDGFTCTGACHNHDHAADTW